MAEGSGGGAGTLAGRVAVVTGGASGIGFGLARALARRGAQVLLADLAGAEAAAGMLRAEGLAAEGIAADVSSEVATAAMAEAAETRFGGLDILVNNAGIYATLTPKPFEELDLAEWRHVLEVNVMGTFLCCRAVLPAMQRRGGGRIVNISSGVAFKGNPYMAHYVASKGAVVSLTRALATELGRHGILVNSVAPGFTLSEGVLRNPVLVEGVKGPSLRGRVLARDMLPEDLTGAVCFFAGPDAAFITGQTLVVDGGAYFH
ncbi:SDR family NAD(P)-dependent oxidoreductase [Belnapia rosea]|uniref:SDR family NAD(P)-dependent oxidoreductase n=1 Tax=Belnapia rosea TaxID=938405 RepID=UPI00088FA542|nr:glucose 1-dehydrogenase [Belnapia rosea]SDB73310.1 NAD(P)-dependent dehydrogenase, short-chain alcohol dehydrogenase family [Belnapia rosea]